MSPVSDTVLQFDQVAITLGGREILSPVDLSIRRGEFVCVIGPSGCGKTTLLRAAAGFVAPSSGSVHRQGRAITGPSREVAFVFQDYGRALLPWRTVQANVSLALEAAREPVADRPARIARVLQTVGLGAHADKFPAQLSGGMQQRVQIARCLAQQPDVMLMDEPFGALDAMTRETLQDELARLVREEGLTVMFVTHDLEEALYLGDRVIALRSNPTAALPSLAALIEVPLPQPRDQLSTKEHPEFLRLRRELYHYLGH
ncbi:MAG: ABC transporter ATP-binding protein [Hydrogenophaga sp.]|uniref:ABC transporter ATP-binding protein n=1 Tax=Hydrogenophaga sp. TaxID=1904254 RepID=UPI002731E057|nr:ABC transporter ATP-binding protein [Hydrogenophaga sp.]MDP1780618.1 ABC transporter ATP-binding protein [Hydrogenophaga sp.]MDP2249754.1 ABC transporter ATP-binding protein [Hydrogenophaga sp.]